MNKIILNLFSEANITVSGMAIENLSGYYDLLLEYNSKFNLTSITEPEDVVVKHFIDSAFIVKYFPDLFKKKVMDIGTGAGFPGLVLAILEPCAQLTLLEPNKKKIQFLNSVIKQLKLNNVSIINCRAEELGHDSLYREQFDIVVSRALATINILLEYMIPFLKINGSAICYKSKLIDEEIKKADNAFEVLFSELTDIYSFSLPRNFGDRSLVIIKKILDTDSRYPRRNGIPSKRPL